MGHAGNNFSAFHFYLPEKADRFHLTSQLRSVPSGCSVEEDSEDMLSLLGVVGGGPWLLISDVICRCRWEWGPHLLSWGPGHRA